MSEPGPASRRAYAEVGRWLARRHAAGLRVAAISGAQGSGKSTLAAFLVDELARAHGLRAVALSLDDFYLGQAQRRALAASVHPLLATRGVPGTHDVPRGMAALEALRAGRAADVPAFSKAADDRIAERRTVDAADLVLFEGWCVGTPAQDTGALAEPVNELERRDDPQGAWRTYVNRQLAGPYAQWFSLCDAAVFLQVPGWEQVRQWRGQQEFETAAAHGGRSALLDAHARERFLQHYQRLTLHALDWMPARADAVLALAPDHSVGSLRFRDAGA